MFLKKDCSGKNQLPDKDHCIVVKFRPFGGETAMDFVIICNDKPVVTIERSSYKSQSIVFIKTINIAYGLTGLRYLVFSLSAMRHLAPRLLHAGCRSVDSRRP